MRDKTRGLLAATLVLAAAGCATPTVVETRKLADDTLDCEKLKFEVAEANRYEREARKERTVTGTNVAAALFFWPALLGTYANTEEAINAARERREHLLALAKKRQCSES